MSTTSDAPRGDISLHALEDDLNLEERLRPSSLDEMIGQDRLRENLAVFIRAAQHRDETFNGKIFVLTGELESMTRGAAKTEIEKRGGKVTGSVSKKTSVVIVGANPGSKHDKAVKLGVEIWDEAGLLEKLGE